MTENSWKVLEFLQRHPGEEFSYQDLVEELDVSMSTVVGALLGAENKKFVSKRIEEYAPLRANEQPRAIRWFSITETGINYDPEKEARKKAREQAEARAARRAERAREKAERALKNSVL